MTAIAMNPGDALTAQAGMTDSRWEPRPWTAGNDAANAIGLVKSDQNGLTPSCKPFAKIAESGKTSINPR